MVNTHEVARIVKATLKSRLPKIHVSSVNVSDSIDDDGDAIIQIKVVFESESENVEAAKVPSLVREIMLKLSEANQIGFPILSFIAKSDLGKMKPEAA